MKRSSLVWEYFAKIDEKQVKCKLCEDRLSYRGGTSSMLSHVRSKHPTVCQPQQQNVQIPTSNQPPSRDSASASAVQSSQHVPKNQQTMTNYMIGQRKCNSDMMPTYMVEGKGFRQFMGFIEPDYKVPSHQTIMRRINKIYNEVRRNIEKSLENITDVSITTDAWTSLATESYITVTAHFIDTNWEMQTFVVDTSEMDERHSAENLAIRLEMVKMEWSLEGKIRVCVRDNAANQVAAGRLCEDWEDFPCFAHTLQLAVKEGFAIEEVNLLIKAASKIVKYFKKSASATTALDAAQIKLKVEQHRLIQSCKTRWNSVYEMFQRLESQKQCVQVVLSDHNIVKPTKEEKLPLSVVQWNKITSLLPVLHALQIATTAMSSEQNTSVSCILPVVTGLLKNFLDVKIQDWQLLREFKRKVSQVLKERFFMDLKGDSVAAVSSASDPRHKNLKFLSSEMQFSVQEHVRFLVNLVTTDKEPVVEEEPATKKSAMVLLLGSDYYDDQQLLRDEYSYFLEEPAMHPNSNPLIW
ncbi:E3 SUMO-protein ligase ZBED1-like [Rhopilema esculentum]|uniref:E3 SUMO-protein ligase ZBED1-like n=1 Tax=Rhopilema esculentum TaxID=499914 RepID=UPI0031DCD192